MHFLNVSVLSIFTTSLILLYVLVRHRSGLSNLALIGGLCGGLGLEVFDQLALAYPESFGLWKGYGLVCEAVLPGFWLLYAVTFARHKTIRGQSLVTRLLLALSLLFPIAAWVVPMGRMFYAPDFPVETMLFLGASGYVFYVAVMVYLCLAVMQLEKTFRALAGTERPRVNFEILGIGVLLSALLVYYSQALLYRSLDMGLISLRSLFFGLGVALMGWGRIWHGDLSKIRVSKDMAFGSVVLLMVGGYFIGIGMMGEGMRYLGVSTQRSFFISILTLCGLAFFLVVISERLRREVKVLLHKHFYANKHDYRKQWLDFTARLCEAGTRDELESAILKAYSETFSLVRAALYQLDADRDEFCLTSSLGTDAFSSGFKRSHPFFHHLAQSDWVFSIQDEFPAGTQEMKRIFVECEVLFCVPLLFNQNLEGFILLGRQEGRQERFIYEDYDLMKVLAHQATSTLLNQKLSAQLSTAQEMAALGKVSTFVMHDLKNQVSNLSLVVSNARDFIDDPEFQADMLESLENTASSMKELIMRLKNIQIKPELNLVETDLMELVYDNIHLLGTDDVVLCGEPVPVMVDITEFKKVVQNLMLNARESRNDTSPIEVKVGFNGMAFLKIKDRGCGMSEEFIRSRLFKPFETTKKKGFGIGLFQCRQLVDAHGGRIEVESAEGQGTTFTVILPGMC